MKTFAAIALLRQQVSDWRREGLRIGFVPTMGNLHAGHFALVELAKQHSDRVVASIFVNPTQFGPNEDYARYPRTPDSDIEGLRSKGCDALLLPSVEEMYPFGTARGAACRRGPFRCRRFGSAPCSRPRRPAGRRTRPWSRLP